jgi:hypothetical protein
LPNALTLTQIDFNLRAERYDDATQIFTNMPVKSLNLASVKKVKEELRKISTLQNTA